MYCKSNRSERAACIDNVELILDQEGCITTAVIIVSLADAVITATTERFIIVIIFAYHAQLLVSNPRSRSAAKHGM